MKEQYVIVDNKTKKYIAIDQSSGGYPYESNLASKIWSSKAEAKKYADMFGERSENWSLHTLEVSIKPCSWI